MECAHLAFVFLDSYRTAICPTSGTALQVQPQPPPGPAAPALPPGRSEPFGQIPANTRSAVQVQSWCRRQPGPSRKPSFTGIKTQRTPDANNMCSFRLLLSPPPPPRVPPADVDGFRSRYSAPADGTRSSNATRVTARRTRGPIFFPPSRCLPPPMPTASGPLVTSPWFRFTPHATPRITSSLDSTQRFTFRTATPSRRATHATLHVPP